MTELGSKQIRAFVVWEPVLFTDWSSPSNMTLRRILDTRAAQFWDKDRLISHSMGEHDRGSVVWDNIAVYPAGSVWDDRPPQPLYDGGPVLRVTEEARAALTQALQRNHVQEAGSK
jgi:hypothetical protein